MKLLISLLLVAATCGCATVRRALYDEKPVQLTPQATNQVVVILTNATPTAVTNVSPAGVTTVSLTTNYVVTLSTNYVVTPATWATNLVVKPSVEATVDVAGAAPVPGAPIAGAVASLAIAAYASWVNRRNQATAAKVAGTLVDNFEQLRKVALTLPGYTPTVDYAVMADVKNLQLGAGVKHIINGIVDQRTEPTTKPNGPV